MKQIKTLLLLFWIAFLFSVSFSYSSEEINAYNYAYENWITTMNSIENANMWWNLTRIAMAKMLSNYAINVIWLNPDTTKLCNFPDVPYSLDAQYDNWVTKACQLGLMWVGIDQFYPYWQVTRAEFGTVLSRALNADDLWMLSKLNSATPYYIEHLRFLNKEWIMNNISNPISLERRWRVMLMLMRAYESTLSIEWPHVIIKEKNQDVSVDIDYDRVIYRNVVYGIQIDFRSIWKWSIIKKTTWWDITWIEDSPFDHDVLNISKNGNSVIRIDVYSYDEYSRILELSKDEPICDEKCFKDSIIWHNNKYYFGLWISNKTHEELKDLIPNLQCSEHFVWNNTEINCEWWVNQMFPEWSFEFFDVKGNEPTTISSSEKPIYSIFLNSDNWFNVIDKSWVLFKNYAHGIQIDFGSIWSWAYLMTSNKKIDMTFSGVSVANITMFTYDEYEDAIVLSHDNVLCDEKCFKDSIIWHNNTYYFRLNTSNMTHEELKVLIPDLQCSERVVWNTTWIVCDWFEEVNWKLIKTWKDWVEQLFPEWCFEFFDPELED